MRRARGSQERVWCCCRGQAAGARDGCAAACSRGRWSLSREESGSASLRLISYILRTPNHVETPWGMATLAARAGRPGRPSDSAAGVPLCVPATPGLTTVPPHRALGPAWAKGSHEGTRHRLHTQPALSEGLRPPKGTWHLPKRCCVPVAIGTDAHLRTPTNTHAWAGGHWGTHEQIFTDHHLF